MATARTIGSYHPSGTPTQRDLQYTYDTIRDWARLISTCPLLQGQIIEQVHLTPGDHVVYHGLGRRPVGILPVLLNAQVMISVSSVTDKAVTLSASGDATANLWVF